MLLIGGGAIVYSNISAKQKEEYYKNKLTSTLEELEIATTNSAVMASTYQKYWGKSIDSNITSEYIEKDLEIKLTEYESLLNYNNSQFLNAGIRQVKRGEFNTMLKIVTLAKLEELDLLTQELDKVSELVSELKNPPEKYESEYNSLLKIFENYNSFNSLATSPVGSYIEYSKNINSFYETISSKTQTLKLQID